MRNKVLKVIFRNNFIVVTTLSASMKRKLWNFMNFPYF